MEDAGSIATSTSKDRAISPSDDSCFSPRIVLASKDTIQGDCDGCASVAGECGKENSDDKSKADDRGRSSGAVGNGPKQTTYTSRKSAGKLEVDFLGGEGSRQ